MFVRLYMQNARFMHIVIFAGGDFIDSPLSRKVIKKADRILAADHGADLSLQIGIVPDVVLGDFDSLSSSSKRTLVKKKIPMVTFKKEKDETDTELAVMHAIELGATKITLLGALSGNRFDHIIANLYLGLTLSVPLEFINGNQHVLLISGPASVSLKGKKGDILSLIPLQEDVLGITTKNLYYPLNNEPLVFGRPRGVSNVFIQSAIEIAFQKGKLLIVHSSV